MLAGAAAGRDRWRLDRSRPCQRQVLRAPLPGNPRCCCVRVCQSPVLTGGSGRRRALSHPVGGCCCRRWPRMKVLYERVAGIDVHKDMIKVAIRSAGDKPWTRKTEILEYRTFYGVLQQMARELR